MNGEKFTIRVKIAERLYPITIARSEEETFRTIARQINDLILQFSQRYPDRDMQDFMAMALLQLGSQLKRSNELAESKDLVKKLEQLDKTLEDFLVEEQVL